jgi:hypothetical protein
MAGLVAEQEKTLDRVRKLIQQSASDTRAEAELAAYKACALIRRAGLEVVDPSELDGLLTENEELKRKVALLEAGTTPDWDPVTAQAHQAFQSTQAFQTHSYYSTATMVQPMGPWQAQVSQPTPPPPAMKHPVPLVSKYVVSCRHCGKRLGVGDPILWQKHVGVWCQTTDCYNNWQASLQPFNMNPNFNPFP